MGQFDLSPILLEENMKASEIVHVGPWQIAVKVENVLCSDGKQRLATVRGEALDAWSLPCSVSVKEHTVSGFVTWDSTKEVHIFHAYSHKKNGYLLP